MQRAISASTAYPSHGDASASMNVPHLQIEILAIVRRRFRPHFSISNSRQGHRNRRRATRSSLLNPEQSSMPKHDSDHLRNLRTALMHHPLYTDVLSVPALMPFLQHHAFPP